MTLYAPYHGYKHSICYKSRWRQHVNMIHRGNIWYRVCMYICVACIRIGCIGCNAYCSQRNIVSSVTSTASIDLYIYTHTHTHTRDWIPCVVVQAYVLQAADLEVLMHRCNSFLHPPLLKHLNEL